ncbi:MAG: LytR C-terminal domain-containing protein, partial [Solirubrobacteraceae bacterium]
SAPARAAASPPRAPARATGSRTVPGAPRRATPAGPNRSRGRLGATVVAGILAIAAVVVALLLLTSGGGSPQTSSRSGLASNAPAGKARGGSRAGAALKPSTVSVVVLNGTATFNLAHDVSQRLAGAGYKTGTPASAPDQTQTATVVGYRPGERRAALLVARSLKLGSASVQAVSQSDQAVACPQSSPCTAQVVVTVGSDLASSATTSSASTT